MTGYFITGIGTDAGKTYITCQLIAQLHEREKNYRALKPLVSGYNANDPLSDTALLLKAQHLSDLPHAAISPWRFKAPLAPCQAAAMEGKTLSLDAISDFCIEQKRQFEWVLVEGAGGIMSPVNSHYTMLDWAQKLNWPVILVANDYLGAISHTLTAYRVLQQSDIPVHAIIINEQKKGGVGLEITKTALKPHIKDPVYTVPYRGILPDLFKELS